MCETWICFHASIAAILRFLDHAGLQARTGEEEKLKFHITSCSSASVTL